jgi:D-alanyl-D-alanine carboxypeptidase
MPGQGGPPASPRERLMCLCSSRVAGRDGDAWPLRPHPAFRRPFLGTFLALLPLDNKRLFSEISTISNLTLRTRFLLSICYHAQINYSFIYERINSMNKRRILKQIRFAQAIIACLLSFVFFNNAFADTSSKPFEQKTQKKLESFVTQALKETGSPGIIAGVWTPKGYWIRGEGFADLKTKRIIEPSDLFRIGSTTKPFTATIVLQLVDEGKLKLDDKISEFNFGVKIPGADKISIRHLLNHTSGLFGFDDDEEFFKEYLNNLTEVWPTKKLIKIALSHPRYNAPGKEFHYSNTNYLLLSMIVEQVTGNKFNIEMNNRIFEPLGMKDTYLPKGSKIKGRHVHGYMKTKDGHFRDSTKQNLSWKWAQGGIISNIGDLRTWTEALGRGTLLKPATQKERLKWVYDHKVKYNPLNTRYGLGIASLGAGDWIGHTGGEPGYLNFAYYSPREDATIIIFFNTLSIHDASEEGQKPLVRAILCGNKLFVNVAKTVLPESFENIDVDKMFSNIQDQ